MQDTESMEIIALGEPLMELSAEQTGGLESVRTFRPGFGGDASNFAVAASRAGGKVGMLARVGADPFGDSFLSMWAREGVDTSLVQRCADAPTGLYIITRTGGGHEFTYYRTGSAASRLTPDQLPEESIRRARLLHVTGVSQGISDAACDASLAAMELAREAGVLVSYDPNYRPTLWPLGRARAVINASIALADIVIPSMEEVELLLGITEPQRAAQRYLEMGAGIVALKLGAQGALIATAEGMQRVAPLVVDAVDASGAGDTFAGAFAASYLEHRPLDWCARFAITAAGLSTTRLGCVSSMPTREQVLERMSREGAAAPQ